MLEATPAAAGARRRRGRAAARRGDRREDRRQRRPRRLPARRTSRRCWLPSRRCASRASTSTPLNTTTCCATPALMMNGPARQTLGIECGYSCLGHNGRANATIGRALRLVMRNVGGSMPGAVSKSMFGQPGRVSLCFGEWEEKSPWEPFHVRRGFRAEQSVMTARRRPARRTSPTSSPRRGEELICCSPARSTGSATTRSSCAQDKGDMLLLLCPDFAHKIARDGIASRRCSACCSSGRARPSSAGPAATGRSSRSSATSTATSCPLAAHPEQFLIARRRRRVRAPRALLLHLRPHLDGEHAVRGRRRLRGR